MGEMPYEWREQTPGRQRPESAEPRQSARLTTLLWAAGPACAGILLGLWIIAGNDLIFSPDSAGVPAGEADGDEIKRAWADAALDRLLGDALIQILAIVGIILAAALFFMLGAKKEIARRVTIGLIIGAAAMVAAVIVYAGLAILPLT